MAELISMTYEQARAEHFKTLKDEAKHKMNYWATRVRRSRPNDLNDPAHIRAGEYAAEYSYYKDALEALEDNRFQYETGFVKGFESAQPKWISVDADQKPRHGKEYLCVCSLPDDPKHEWDWMDVLRWFAHGTNGYVDRPHFTNEGLNGMIVTHWMELPKRPKEEK